MRTLEEIDLEILENANIPNGMPIPWHDPCFNYNVAASIKSLGAKYREMYHLLRDLEDFLDTDFSKMNDGPFNETLRKNALKIRLNEL